MIGGLLELPSGERLVEVEPVVLTGEQSSELTRRPVRICRDNRAQHLVVHLQYALDSFRSVNPAGHGHVEKAHRNLAPGLQLLVDNLHGFLTAGRREDLV